MQKILIAEGALNGVAAIFGGHFYPDFEVGQILLKPGIVMASADNFILTVHGKSSHGAKPDDGKDAIVCASQLVSAVQTLVSRELSPTQTGLISICKFHSGTAPNIISDKAVLEGTVRAHLPEVRELLVRRFQEIVNGLSSAFGQKIDLEFPTRAPAVKNHDGATEIAYKVAGKIAGQKCRNNFDSTLGAEDFAYYLEKIPGCFANYGCRIADYPYYPLHSDKFRLNEDALPIAMEYLSKVAIAAGSLNLETEPLLA